MKETSIFIKILAMILVFVISIVGYLFVEFMINYMDTHDKTLNPDPVNTFLDNTPDNNTPPLFTQTYSKGNAITGTNFAPAHEIFVEDNIDLKRVTPNIIENEISYETTGESGTFSFLVNRDSETYGLHSIFKFKDSDANNANVYTRTLHYYAAADPKTQYFIGNKFDFKTSFCEIIQTFCKQFIIICFKINFCIGF